MAKKLERIQGFRVVVDPDGTLFLKHQETENLAEKFTDKETFEITACVHGHPIRAPQEMGGSVFVAGYCARNALSYAVIE